MYLSIFSYCSTRFRVLSCAIIYKQGEKTSIVSQVYVGGGGGEGVIVYTGSAVFVCIRRLQCLNILSCEAALTIKENGTKVCVLKLSVRSHGQDGRHVNIMVNFKPCHSLLFEWIEF